MIPYRTPATPAFVPPRLVWDGAAPVQRLAWLEPETENDETPATLTGSGRVRYRLVSDGG